LGERYLRVKLKDRLNGIFLILQSPIVALLLILIYGGSGYSQYRENPTTLLSVLIIASIWFGVINSVREIVSERAIYYRERLFGLRVLPYIFLQKLSDYLEVITSSLHFQGY